jgi:glutamine amidotransferase
MISEVILIDAGTGNLRSVQKALESLGAAVERTDDPQKVLSGKRVILPGVGAFGDFMSGLRARGLDSVIKEAAARGVPLLGICVGMQAFFEVGQEMGQHQGLGLLPGRVARFEKMPGIKIPHTGWNQLEAERESSLFDQVDAGAYAYFNHSYFCQPADSSDIIARTEYGHAYACAVRRENIYGVQFHPEKSQAVGLQILENFLEVK